jgi:hypothetical protein
MRQARKPNPERQKKAEQKKAAIAAVVNHPVLQIPPLPHLLVKVMQPATPLLEAKMETNNSNKKPILFGVVGLLLGALLGVGGSVLLKLNQPTSTSAPKKATVIKKPQITGAVVSSSIDKDGKAVNPTDVFSKKEKSIYAVASLKDVSKGTKMEFVRYLNGKYLDSKIGTVDKDNLKYYSFVWNTKDNTKEHLGGVYSVKLYINGNANESVNYIVK